MKSLLPPRRHRSSSPWLGLLLMGSLGLYAADWPRWRGPHGDGHVPASVAVPNSLPAEPKTHWRLKLGDGFGSPVVSAGRVFYLDHREGKEVVQAAEASTGKALWNQPLDEAFKDSVSAAGPRGTPLVDDGRVFVQSCRGEFQCLNAADGQLLWRFHFVKDFNALFIGEKGAAIGASRHGYTGAPVVKGDRLFVGVGGTNGASVVCFDKRSGRVIWKSQSDVPGHAGPILATLGGAEQIVSFTAEAVMGLARESGALLWRWPVQTRLGRHVSTPVVVEERVIVTSHTAGLMALRIAQSGDGPKAELAWASKDLAINFASPVVAGEFLYGVGPERNLICVDTRTGRLAWSKSGLLSGSGGSAHAGFLVMGSNLLVLTDGGLLLLIAADSSAYRELSRAQVCGQNWCVPAYADGNLYLRDGHELRRVQLLP